MDPVRRSASSSRTGRALAIAGAVVVLGSCHGWTQPVTGMRIVTSWTDVEVDQLEFNVLDMNGRSLVASQRRPPQPARPPLKSGADIVVYLSDNLGGTSVQCAVRAMSAGREVASSMAMVHLIARTVVKAQLVLVAAPGAKIDGAPCADGMECQSQTCADAVCCHTPCSGLCQSCALPGKQGKCSPIPAGLPHPGCAVQKAETCGFDGFCDGRGDCRQYPAGTRCAPGNCNGANISSVGACDGVGHCAIGPVLTCAPFDCDASGAMPGCFNSCTTSAQCVPGRDCVAGSCGKKYNGAACRAGPECNSGYCVDGICCDSKCDGPCLSCAQIGFAGTCRASPAGVKDLRGICKDEGSTSCGQTGTCDGLGGCAHYSAGTICQAAVCMGSGSGILRTAGRCDGVGTCDPGGPLNCAPFGCSNAACNASCMRNEDCAIGTTCDLGTHSCGKKGLGQSCTGGDACTSGFCVDKVCCNEACQGACYTCAEGQVPGNCSAVAVDTPDPRGVCKNLGEASCGTTGMCDGAGACAKYPPGTVCGSQTCDASTSTWTMPPTCDTDGKCAVGAAVSCGAYRCNGAQCFSACSSDSECVAPNACLAGACAQRGSGAPCSSTMACAAPFTCVGSVCQLKALGIACAADADCNSGHCTEGVCCDSGPCGTCRSCKVMGFVGYCHAKTAGTADSQCTIDAVSTCKKDGKCNGAGSCRLYASGTVCTPASCSVEIRNKAKTCDGSGNCQSHGTTNCAPYMCNTSTRDCYTSCSSDSQCYNGGCSPGNGVCH